MKNVFLFLFLGLFAFSLNAQTNSNREYWTSKRWQPKQGHGQDFVNAAAQKTKMFNMSPETAIMTYRVVDGPDQGMYERVVPARTMQNLYTVGDGKQLDYWGEHVMPHVKASEGMITWWRIKGLCNNWTEGAKPAKHITVRTIVVETGKEEAVRRYLDRVAKIRSANNPSRGIGVFKVASGGQDNTYRIINFFDDPAQAWGKWTSEKGFEDEYNDMFGYNARDVDSKAYNEALLPWGKYSERMQLVEAASYMGPE